MAVALAAADPAPATAAALGRIAPPAGRVRAIAFGKAAAPMAHALERCWGPMLGNRLSGLCVVPDSHGLPLDRLTLLEAAHPTPDARSEQAGRLALRMAGQLAPNDMLLALVSGGGSSLLAAPAPGLTLTDKQAVTRAMLAAGEPIARINTARIALSAIKGGRLAAAAGGARVETLIVSDVPGNAAWAVASGPTVIGPGPAPAMPHWADLLTDEPLVARVAHAAAANTRPDRGDRWAEPAIILSPDPMLAAVAAAARREGVIVHNLGDRLQGDASALAADHARMAASAAKRPCLILSGGEAGVRVRGAGQGGRNAHYCLALAIELDRLGIPAYGLAIDTDGIDGNSPAAGAMLRPDSLARARAAGLDPGRSLQACDSFTLWQQLGRAIVTGPTRTNLNDLRMLLLP